MLGPRIWIPIIFLRDLDFKVPVLRIWISIVIYLTGLGLENTLTTNLDYDY